MFATRSEIPLPAELRQPTVNLSHFGRCYNPICLSDTWANSDFCFNLLICKYFTTNATCTLDRNRRQNFDESRTVVFSADALQKCDLQFPLNDANSSVNTQCEQLAECDTVDFTRG